MGCDLGDAVIFDMRTLHGTLSETIPKTLSRYLKSSKEGAKISYDGDWTSFNYKPFKMQDIKTAMLLMEKCFQLFMKLLAKI